MDYNGEKETHREEAFQMKRYRGACLLFTLLLAAALTGCGGQDGG